MPSFELLCVSSLPAAELEVVREAGSIAERRDQRLTLTLLSAPAPAERLRRAGLLLCLSSDPQAPATVAHAHALGVPVILVDDGGEPGAVRHGSTGIICPAAPVPLADAISWLTRRTAIRERLRAGGLLAAGERLAQPA